MNLTVHISNIHVTGLQTGSNKPSNEEIQKKVVEAISTALSMTPISEGQVLSSYTLEVLVEPFDDIELDYMQKSANAFRKMTADGRRRVLQWLVARFGEK